MDALTRTIYDEVRRIAARHVRAERAGGTLQTGDVANEVWLRLLDDASLGELERPIVLGRASHLCRRVLVDYARKRNALKRGGDRAIFSLTDDPLDRTAISPADLLAIDEAITDLTKLDERHGFLVSMRFFAGLTFTEIATLLDRSPRAITDDWRFARAWLRQRLEGA